MTCFVRLKQSECYMFNYCRSLRKLKAIRHCNTIWQFNAKAANTVVLESLNVDEMAMTPG